VKSINWTNFFIKKKKPKLLTVYSTLVFQKKKKSCFSLYSEQLQWSHAPLLDEKQQNAASHETPVSCGSYPPKANFFWVTKR